MTVIFAAPSSPVGPACVALVSLSTSGERTWELPGSHSDCSKACLNAHWLCRSNLRSPSTLGEPSNIAGNCYTRCRNSPQ